MTLWPWLILVTAYGACIGSFLNVVILRLPKGQSLVRPGSHDPETGDKLQWWENIPIFSWLALRGRSRYSGKRISVQYPLVEAFTAVAFGGLFVVYYMTPLRPAFSIPGLSQTWPAFVVHLVLLGALIAATMIDFRHFIIPLQIPWFVTAAALVILPLAALSGLMPNTPVVVPPAPNTPPGAASCLVNAAPTVNDVGMIIAIGGLLGLILSLVLMQLKVIPRSFDDEEIFEQDSPDPETFLAHPHPRREILKEFLFVGFPLLGMLIGLVTAYNQGLQLGPSQAPMYVQVLGGVIAGYLVGGGMVWITRILGTLVFGKEAMGLGDVHLMAAVGAVIGAMDVTVTFFIAPFFGLAAALILVGLTAILKGKTRIIPYGPYLAGAAVIMMLFRVPILRFLGILC